MKLCKINVHASSLIQYELVSAEKSIIRHHHTDSYHIFFLARMFSLIFFERCENYWFDSTLLVIKVEYICIYFFRSNIETYCFFFGSFITLEQLNDYVMILEYQGEINICKILRYVTWPFVWSYGRPYVPYSVLFPAPILCAMKPCFFQSKLLPL